VDGTGRSVEGAAWVGQLSPFFLYGRSKPLIASYGADPLALLGLVALAALLGAAGFPLFAGRDLGGVAWARARGGRRTDVAGELGRAARDTSLRGVGLRALRADAPAVGWWVLGLALFVVWTIGITQAIKDALVRVFAESPVYRQILTGLDLGSDAGFLSGLVFAFLPVLLTLYALTQAAGWARDLDAGRLELVLGTPTSRRRAFLETWGATLAALVVVPLTLWLVALAGVRAWGLRVAGGDLAAAFLGFLPLELLVAALVFLAAGRVPAGAITGAVGGFIALSYLMELLRAVLDLPSWLAGLSIFHHYGTPILDGPRWGPWLALTALAAALLALGLARFTRSDIQRGG
jgi:ABC-2 type transport system permease protein